MPSNISELATPKMLPRLQGNLKFLTTLFVITGWVLMMLLSSMLLRNRCCATGLSTEVILHIPLTSELCFERSNRLLGGSDFSSDILRSNWESLQVWTQSVHKLSITQKSTNTLCSLAQSWIRKKFHGVMYTIWTKKDVSKEGAEECRLSNTLSPIIGDLNTSSAVQIVIITGMGIPVGFVMGL
jgi:hypothetical protein